MQLETTILLSVLLSVCLGNNIKYRYGLDLNFNPLIDVKIAIYTKSSNYTNLLLAPDDFIITDPEHCVSVLGIAKLHCGEVSAGIFRLPLVLSGLVWISSSIHSKYRPYFVKEIDSLPVIQNFVFIFNISLGAIKFSEFSTKFTLSYYEEKYPGETKLAFNVIGVESNSMSLDRTVSELYSKEVDPGSFFYSLTPVFYPKSESLRQQHHPPLPLLGFPNYGYLEIVYNKENIIEQRYIMPFPEPNRYPPPFVSDTTSSRNSSHSSSSPGNHSTSGATGTTRGINLCFYGNDRMDGQKQIWLQQSQYLNKNKFHLKWFINHPTSSTNNTTTATSTIPSAPKDGSIQGGSFLTELLRQNRSNIILQSKALEFHITAGELEALAVTDSITATLFATSHNSQLTSDDLLRFVLQRFLLANRDVKKTTPIWVQEIIRQLQSELLEAACDIVIFANSRGFSHDAIVVEVSRSLHIPTVSELANLFLHPDAVPSVVVSPSHFSLLHPSVANTLKQSPHSPLLVVIPPAVSLDQFYPLQAVRGEKPTVNVANDVIWHPGCEAVLNIKNNNDAEEVKPCFVIGFMGRLSVEKNPGLFIQAAYDILQRLPFARFMVIGDGPLLLSLKDLTVMLRIDWAVHFTGWLSSDEVPKVLRGLDVLVNPSLRASSETFCIANIQGMATGIPLITFAVGGIGEYVYSSSPQNNNNNFNPTEWKLDSKDPPSIIYTQLNENYDISNNYKIGYNAILLDKATPDVIAEVVELLYKNNSLRNEIGNKGRETIAMNFAVERQISQYESLYAGLLKTL